MFKVVSLSAVILSLLLAAILLRNGDLLLLVLPLLIYIGTSILQQPQKPTLTATRTLSKTRVAANEDVTVTVEIRNNGDLIHAYIKDRLPEKVQIISGKNSDHIFLESGETTILEYTISGQRGMFQFGNIIAKTSDTFGLFQEKAIINAPATLFVMPTPLTVRDANIRPRQTRVYAGKIPARVGGSGIDFFAVRDYRTGDSLRQINWRASAKHERNLYSNTFEQERAADVGIILDARISSHIERLLTVDHSSETELVEVGERIIPNMSENLFNYTVQAAATIAETFLSDGNRLALLQYGRYIDWTFPGYGKVARERIMYALARAQLGDHMVFANLSRMPTRFFPPASQIIFVSPLLKDDAAMLYRLSRQGYQVLVVSPDPHSFEFAGITAPTAKEAFALRLAQAERALMMRQLQASGVRVISWDTNRPLDQTLNAAFSNANWQQAYGGRS